ncbi:hypothetical protein QUB70_24095 [Microcoleus sp. A003_D6]
MALHRLRSLLGVLQNRFQITELGTGNWEWELGIGKLSRISQAFFSKLVN